jgi:hypothetical protein
MVPKHELLKSIPLHIQEQNYGKDVYELEDHVGEKTFSSNLSPKFGPTTPFANFLNYPLENA